LQENRHQRAATRRKKTGHQWKKPAVRNQPSRPHRRLQKYRGHAAAVQGTVQMTQQRTDVLAILTFVKPLPQVTYAMPIASSLGFFMLHNSPFPVSSTLVSHCL